MLFNNVIFDVLVLGFLSLCEVPLVTDVAALTHANATNLDYDATARKTQTLVEDVQTPIENSNSLQIISEINVAKIGKRKSQKISHKKGRSKRKKTGKNSFLRSNVAPSGIPRRSVMRRKRKRKQKSAVRQSQNTTNRGKTMPEKIIGKPEASNLTVEVRKFGKCGKKRGGCAHICNSKGITRCSCLEGFYLGSDGRSCFDVNECEKNNGGCEKECVNLLGTYACKCPAGFTLADDRTSCRDVDECLPRNGHGPCQDTCENTFGSYECSCEALSGTKLGADGHVCDDLNECDLNNGGCSHNCINTLGRSFCSCPDGMELSSDWKTCQDVNECDFEDISDACKHCINAPGSYYCLGASEMQSDQSGGIFSCKPLFPPTRGFVSCTRRGAFRSYDRKGRKRTINSPGTVCELICPAGFKLTGQYHVLCGTNGDWVGHRTGKCIESPPPVLKCPPSQKITLEDGSNAALVKFSSPITNVNWKYLTGHPKWAEDLQQVLPKGTHEIGFTVRDPATKMFSTCSFKIVVS